MKITSVKANPFEDLSTKAIKGEIVEGPDLLPARKPPRRRIKKSGGGLRLKKEVSGGLVGKGVRPETPLLRWKFGDGGKEEGGGGAQEDNETASEVGRRNGRKGKVAMSARKVGAALWRMQLPEVATNDGDRIRFQSGVRNVAFPSHGHHVCEVHISPNGDLVQSPPSVSGPKNGFSSKVEPFLRLSNSAMEGATKWDPLGWKTSDDQKLTYGQAKHVDQQGKSALMISSLEAELEQAQTRIHELETEGRSSKKKLENFLRKLSEEKAAWRSREHEKVRAIMDDMKADINRERKNRHRLEIVNSKLVNELADVKLSAKRYMVDYEEERKARELIEEVCDELAKEIGDDKAEIEELKRESMRLREEVDEERRMLQMAEVWREERVQMKLVDAKVMLEDKYALMNRLIAELESFLNSKGATPGTEEMRQAELLRQAAASLNIQDIREFTYEPPNPDDIFSIFTDVNYCEPNEGQVEPCGSHSSASRASKIHAVSPEANLFKKDKMQRHPNAYIDPSSDLEEDRSEWETVSHLEDQGSSYSPGASDPSVIRSRRDSNVSRSGSEWERNTGEGTPISEISEVCSVHSHQLKKGSSISRLWRSTGSGENYKIISLEGVNGKVSNGRISNGAIHSPDYNSGKDGLSHPDLSGQWGSTDSTNLHKNRGMKGCVEWPRSAQKNSLKAKLLEARMESQKIQLRQVLKQKI